MTRVSIYRIFTAASVTALLVMACEFPFQFLSNGVGDGSEVENSVSDSTEQASAFDGEEDFESSEGDMSNFRCPDSPEAYELWFDHDVNFETPGFGTWDVMTSGAIVLSVAEGLGDKTVHMPFQPGEVIVPGTVSAGFGRGDQVCEFEGEMEVIVNIDGFCDRGVVHLNIVENWGDIDTTMTCCSAGQDCDTFPYQWMLPVIQYEDLEFSANNGYQVSKPFGGGEGQLTWSLQVPVEPVPLTE